MTTRIHSTRLFPKGSGANAYRLSGLAASCDWVVLSDGSEPYVSLCKKAVQPETVFLSLRAPFKALAFFFEEVLAQITKPFVLVSGSEDVTVPNQIDCRWRPFNNDERQMIESILADSRLLRWFAENVDEMRPKLEAIPLGMVFSEGQPPAPPLVPHEIDHAMPYGVPPLQRLPTALCCHRVRQGDQWQPRVRVNDLCAQTWSGFTRLITQEIPAQEFASLLEQHAFCMCVEGGGLDPSPKAWQALLHGCIPIVRRNPTSMAYQSLPVAYVDDWSAGELSQQRLNQWLEQYQSWFVSPELRRDLMQQLSADYWIRYIRKPLDAS